MKNSAARKLRNTGKGILVTAGILLMLIKGVSAYTARYNSIPHQVDMKVRGRITKIAPTLEFDKATGNSILTYARIYVSTNNENTAYYAGTYSHAAGWYERCHVGDEVVLEGFTETGTGVFPIEGVHNLANVCR